LAHRALDPFLKIGWGLEIGGVCSKTRAKALMVFVALGADSAPMKMIFDLQRSHRVELMIQVAGN
jgi:hypothetical protein